MEYDEMSKNFIAICKRNNCNDKKLDDIIKKYIGYELCRELSNYADECVSKELTRLENTREWITGKPYNENTVYKNTDKAVCVFWDMPDNACRCYPDLNCRCEHFIHIDSLATEYK